MRRTLLAAALAAFGTLAGPGNAQACSCLQLAPHRAMEKADAAIVGRLLEVVPRSAGMADYRYRVQGVYKGAAIGRTISVRSSTQGPACGLPKRTGRHYGLLLTRDGGRWRGGLCGVLSPTTLRSAARRSASGSRRDSGSPCAA